MVGGVLMCGEIGVGVPSCWADVLAHMASWVLCVCRCGDDVAICSWFGFVGSGGAWGLGESLELFGAVGVEAGAEGCECLGGVADGVVEGADAAALFLGGVVGEGQGDSRGVGGVDEFEELAFGGEEGLEVEEVSEGGDFGGEDEGEDEEEVGLEGVGDGVWGGTGLQGEGFDLGGEGDGFWCVEGGEEGVGLIGGWSHVGCP